MSTISAPLLLAAELKSLRQLAGAAATPPMSGRHRAKLIRSGFAVFHTGALTVTTMGRARLAFEITRASWRPIPV
jgi:hypothetical protein